MAADECNRFSKSAFICGGIPVASSIDEFGMI
jgi:hypothetical protein